MSDREQSSTYLTKTLSRAGEAHPVRELCVEVTAGPDQGAHYQHRARQPLSIGASRRNDVTLTDPTVSSYHLELHLVEDGVRVLDLGSRNGTRILGVRVIEAVVPPETVLVLGETSLRIRDVEAARVAAGPGPTLPGIVGSSPAMDAVRRSIRRLGAYQASVLIQGETGTGKELVARALHELGGDAGAPFVIVDCEGVPVTQLEEELFGRAGVPGLPGAFERAEGGTLFLDQVGELPPSLQASLLAVLDRKCVRRIGSSDAIAATCRVVASTNRDLRRDANDESFRPELYYRLAGTRIYLPPLRERVDDIPDLVQHFARQHEVEGNALFGPSVMALLKSHRWAGNVRELQNAVETAVLTGHFAIGEDPAVRDSVQHDASLRPFKEARSDALIEFEKAYLTALNERFGGNASAASRYAQIDRSYLVNLLRRHGLR